tara:strand:- start:169 stop:840 length:672 start_codon:yes stop_codon:yes gene_type:complete
MSSHGLLTTAACDANGGLAFALEGSVFIAGAAIQWLRDGLGILEHADESEKMAAILESNEGVYFVPAFVGLGAPHWVPQARGSIFGITRGTSREHLVRAALEAMAYGTREMIEAMEADSSVSMTKLHVDGGVANNDWLMTFQAGILGVPVRRPDMVEITALGAAGLAGLATGVWSDASQFLDSQGEEKQFDSAMQSSERKSLLDGWDQAVRAVKIWSHDYGDA